MTMVDPEVSYARGPDEPGVRDLTFGQVLAEAAELAPDQLALFGTRDERRWTYADLFADAQAGARAMLARFRPGERLAIWGQNLPEWVLAEFACGLSGVVIVTINPNLRPGGGGLRHRPVRLGRRPRQRLLPRSRPGRHRQRAAGPVPVVADRARTRRVHRARRRGTRPRHAAARPGCWRPGHDPVHVRHDRLPEGRAAAPPRPRQQRPPHDGPQPDADRGRAARCDAAVPHRRLGPRRARCGRDPRHARPGRGVRARPRPRRHRGARRQHPDRRADDADRDHRAPDVRANATSPA